MPKQPDDAIRALVDASECLIGVATARHHASDIASPDTTLALATPYLLEETSMAFQSRIPFLIFRSEGIDLQGVTRRNLYITIGSELSEQGRVKVKASRELVTSALEALQRQALKVREQRNSEKKDRLLGTAAKWLVGGALALKGWDHLSRPSCFGEFYFKDPECKDCSFKPRCKAEKARRSGG